MDLRERPSGAFTRHPWEVARTRFFLRVLAAAGVGRAPLAVLDVGAGDAWFASALAARLPHGSAVTCWDVEYDAPDTVRSFSAPPSLTFAAARPASRFDLVLLLDVLEHVEDDDRFVAGIVRENLAEGGRVLVSVPAWRRLFSEHDRRLRHFRRYDPAECRRLLGDAALDVVWAGGLFHSLLPARLAVRALEAVRPPVPGGVPRLEWRRGEWLRRAVGAWLALDTEVSFRLAANGRALPGLSWWALCRR